MNKTTALPPGLRNEVLLGLQKLVMLRLQGAPPEEGIKLVAAVWLEALAALPVAWDDTLDAGRISRAFARLLPLVERWPPPRLLIEQLPPRPVQRRLEAPPPKLSEAQMAANRKRLADLLRMLAEKTDMTTDVKE